MKLASLTNDCEFIAGDSIVRGLAGGETLCADPDGGAQLLDPSYFENGLPPVPDFHGGAENFRSVDHMTPCSGASRDSCSESSSSARRGCRNG